MLLREDGSGSFLLVVLTGNTEIFNNIFGFVEVYVLWLEQIAVVRLRKDFMECLCKLLI